MISRGVSPVFVADIMVRKNYKCMSAMVKMTRRVKMILTNRCTKSRNIRDLVGGYKTMSEPLVILDLDKVLMMIEEVRGHVPFSRRDDSIFRKIMRSISAKHQIMIY